VKTPSSPQFSTCEVEQRTHILFTTAPILYTGSLEGTSDNSEFETGLWHRQFTSDLGFAFLVA
jgi:hypothetical protein